MFFQSYWSWLQSVLVGYIGTQVATVATLLSPVIVTLATVYVMVWGYLMLTGQIKEPVLEGVRRVITIGIILGVAVNLWLYNGPIVDTFFQSPFDMAAAMVGAPPIAMLDSVWANGYEIGRLFWANAGVLNGDFGLYFAALAVWLISGLLSLYAMFLMALARIALSILLALGPLFIGMLFFDSTKRFFEAWIAQLANYGFVAVLTGLVSALVLKLIDTFAVSTVRIGATLQIADATFFLLSTVLAFLLMRQVMPIAAGLASGIALSTGNLIGRAATWGLRGIGNTSRGMLDAFTGGGTSRWDPVSRKLGYYAGRGVARGGKATGTALWRATRGANTLSRKP